MPRRLVLIALLVLPACSQRGCWRPAVEAPDSGLEPVATIQVAAEQTVEVPSGVRITGSHRIEGAPLTVRVRRVPLQGECVRGWHRVVGPAYEIAADREVFGSFVELQIPDGVPPDGLRLASLVPARSSSAAIALDRWVWETHNEPEEGLTRVRDGWAGAPFVATKVPKLYVLTRWRRGPDGKALECTGSAWPPDALPQYLDANERRARRQAARDEQRALDARRSRVEGPEGCKHRPYFQGRITISANPPAIVYRSEEKLGETPFVARPIPAGCHRLRVVFPSLEFEETLEVQIEEGRASRYVLRAHER